MSKKTDFAVGKHQVFQQPHYSRELQREKK
jgi:hypothetical protein